MTISRDAATGGSNAGQSGVVSTAMTTTAGQKLLIAIVQTTHASAFCNVTSLSNDSGVVWSLRSKKQFEWTTPSNTFTSTEVWWGVTAGQLTGDTVTAIVDRTAAEIVLTVMAYSGVPNLVNPWDTGFGSQFASQASGSASQVNAPFSTIAATNGGMIIGAAIANNSNTGAIASSGAGTTVRINTFNNQQWSVEDGLRSTGLTRIQWSGTNLQTAWVAWDDVISADPPPGETGTIAQALTKISQSASGSVTIHSGSITTALRKLSQSATGVEKFTGTIATNLTKISQSAAGWRPVTGTVTTSLRGVSQSVVGHQQLTQGPIVQNLHGISMQASGWTTVTGTVTTVLRGVAQVATDIEIFTGTIETNLSGLGQSAVAATEIFVGTITTRLSRVSQTLVGEEDFVGTITTRLGDAHGQGVGIVGNIEEIIQGPIIMDLSGFKMYGLGAKLGAPSNANWQTYRYTDA